jgi:anaerobic magnesium-protoporphyrin IX monomethyl ester cyclase
MNGYSSVALLEPAVASECIVTELMGQIRTGAPFLAGALTAHGFATRVFAEELLEFDLPLLRRIATEYSAVGLSLALNTLPRGLQVARVLKRLNPDLLLIAGGPSASSYADRLLTVCDYVLKGPGEVSLPLLLQRLNQGGDLDDIPGLIYRVDGHIVRNLQAGAAAAGLTRFDLVEGFGRFTQRDGLFGGPKPVIYSLCASTGCINHCRFCKSPKSYQPRSLDHVMADLQQLLSLHGSAALFRCMLVDDCLFADLEATKELLRRIEHTTRGQQVSFSAQFHVRPTADDELMRLFRAAHFTSLAIGFESNFQPSLDGERKGTTAADNDLAIEQCRRFGIVPYGYFVVGFDTDTLASIHHLFDYIVEKKLIAQVLPVGIMNRDTDGNPTADAHRVLSDTSFGATVFVSHLPATMPPDRLQSAINRGYSHITSLRRLKDLPTSYERQFLFGLHRCFEVWKPAMESHVTHLRQLTTGRK